MTTIAGVFETARGGEELFFFLAGKNAFAHEVISTQAARAKTSFWGDTSVKATKENRNRWNRQLKANSFYLFHVATVINFPLYSLAEGTVHQALVCSFVWERRNSIALKWGHCSVL